MVFPTDQIGEALYRSDLLALSEAAEIYGVELSVVELLSLCKEAYEMVTYREDKTLEELYQFGWCGWPIWLKSRIKIPFGGSAEPVEQTTGIFHVFFVGIHETAEQLERLATAHVGRSSVSRSKIGSTLLADITPIDRVAFRVTENSHRTRG